MRQSHILESVQSLSDAFSRCCNEYADVHVAVAWCGNPNQTLPYKHLEGFSGKITATVGISFSHTHPDAIEWFQGLGANVRIFRDGGELFHPKVYLFTKADRYALFIGSSNLTYGGFYNNVEVNSLIEGDLTEGKGGDVRRLQARMDDWHSPAKSFTPSSQWLINYRKEYARNADKLRTQKISTPPKAEEEISTASWLRNADWRVFNKKVHAGLSQRDSGAEQRYHDVLDAAIRTVPVPWNIQYFADIEKRRMMGGMHPYGWLGHVAASGRVRGMLRNGTNLQWNTIVSCINEISQLEAPIPWNILLKSLNRVVAMGPTMKVWGRLLCIMRPDLYCTVSSTSVRQNLSSTLGVPQNRFDSPAGYIQLIKLIHASPWFNSNKPKDVNESKLWNRRCAFLDAVFY